MHGGYGAQESFHEGLFRYQEHEQQRIDFSLVIPSSFLFNINGDYIIELASQSASCPTLSWPTCLLPSLACMSPTSHIHHI
mmetsp:Transcript_8901/g.12334  ORF Transcript_8901/g.12334 Transcript_8901/m.12334 type:complete len:81 (-) Transcript_8901:3211-3453(-)